MMSKHNKEIITKTITYILLIVVSIYALFPVWWMLSTALKPESQVLVSDPSLIPFHPTMNEFRKLIVDANFFVYIKNSLITASLSTLVSLVLSTFAAYSLSRMHRAPGIKTFGKMMFIAQMTPPVLLVIPIYIIMGKLGLLNTYGALIITYTSFAVPVASWLLKGHFDNLPIDMEEAGFLDGCTQIGVIFRIVLPVSLPTIVATGVYAFVLAWSDFLFGFTLISSNSMRPVTSELGLLQGLWTVQWGQLMAGSVLSVLPVAIIFAFFQRYFVKGLVSGATKG